MICFLSNNLISMWTCKFFCIGTSLFFRLPLNSHYFLFIYLFFIVQDYEIDELSNEYLALHPLASQKQPSLVEEHFEPAMEDEDQSASDSDVSAASQPSEDELGKNKMNKKARAPR